MGLVVGFGVGLGSITLGRFYSFGGDGVGFGYGFVYSVLSTSFFGSGKGSFLGFSLETSLRSWGYLSLVDLSSYFFSAGLTKSLDAGLSFYSDVSGCFSYISSDTLSGFFGGSLSFSSNFLFYNFADLASASVLRKLIYLRSGFLLNVKKSIPRSWSRSLKYS